MSSDFIDTHKPRVTSEPIASGNDYFMGDVAPNAILWDVHGKPKAYDMETAGFARAAEVREIPWLTLRGISDYGTGETRTDDHRFIAAYGAASVLARFLAAGAPVPERGLDNQPTRRGERDNGEAPDGGFVEPEGTLVTLDVIGRDQLPESLRRATRIAIFGRTAVNLCTRFADSIGEALARGVDVQLLIVDPASDVARHLYGKSYSTYLANLKTAQSALDQLVSALPQGSGQIDLRVIDEFAPFSMLIAEQSPPSNSELWVQLNFVRTRIGRDRPIMRIDGMDSWYGVFLTEFEVLWNYAETRPLSADLVPNGG